MYVVLVDWTVSASDAPQFAALLAEQARNSLENEVDCHVFDVCSDPEAQGSFTLYEVYSDAAAFQVHLESAHMAKFAPQADALTLSKSVRILLRLADGSSGPPV
ncbi:MAG: putative quinol monooxygenase [Pseudomonadota bacterium]